MKIKTDKFYEIVTWPECQRYMAEDRSRMHLATDRGWEEFGDSAYFVETSFLDEMEGPSHPNHPEIFVVVDLSHDPGCHIRSPVPLYPIRGLEGIEKFGEYAFFVKGIDVPELSRFFSTGPATTQCDHPQSLL